MMMGRLWLAVALMLAAAGSAVVVYSQSPLQPLLDGSYDGRYHTCGLVTADGVTDHLAEYHARCGGQ